MPYKVLIRCNAGRRVGVGHLSRCLTLAAAMRKKDIECSFMIPDVIEPVKKLIMKSGFSLSEFVFTTLHDDFNITTEYFSSGNFNFIVLDGYDFDNEYLEKMHKKGIPYVYMDDMTNLEYQCTYVFNQNFYAKQELFNALPETNFLLGPRYALLRDEFVSARKNLVRNYPDSAKNILVTFGGSDPTNETMKTLDAFELMNDSLSIRVIIGCVNPLLDDIQKRAGEISKHRIEVLYDVSNMSEQMAWADLVVSNAGTTCMELCSLGLTGLVIVVVDNQILIGKALDELNLFYNLGFHDSITSEMIAKKLEYMIKDKILRKSMSEKCMRMVDGKGADRVAEEIENYCKINC